MKWTFATLDLETDPFEHGKVPKPFASGFYDGEVFISFWGPDCVARIIEAIQDRARRLKCRYLVYAHNGGKFDFFYMMPWFAGDLRIVNSRIIQASIGPHEFRDSYAIMPFALKEYDKLSIDMKKLRADVREQNKEEILVYLKRDCTSLHELVVAFHAEFGDNLTIGGSALKQLKKRHPFKSGSATFDAKFRTDFYFGGRVQVFKAGIIRMPLAIYDVNSMYPYVMANCLHPIGTAADVEVSKKIRKNTCFVVAEGKNYGAFCSRTENGSLNFTRDVGRFCTTIHEWNAAEETGTFQAARIIKTYGFDDRVTFDEFVLHFYNQRKLAKYAGDKIHALFYKYVLNSSYGKFAQNPTNYRDYKIAPRTEAMPEPWLPEYTTDEYIIWAKPTESKHYYNICTGASITGASRAVLLRGLQDADTPIYCDTDSIICKSLRTMAVDDTALGSWKLEGMGSVAAICGKKLYAVWKEGTLFGEKVCIKKAHKGAVLTPEEIWRIAEGEVITAVNPVPKFKMDGQHQFVTRNIRRTA